MVIEKRVLAEPQSVPKSVTEMDQEIGNRQQHLIGLLDGSDFEISRLLPAESLASSFRRPICGRLAKMVKDHLSGASPEWIIMVGARGVGKTTLLAQLYSDPALIKAQKFYLSLDRAQLVDATIADIVAAIEHRLGQSLFTVKAPLFIFLDEVHLIEKWSLAAKIIYDRCRYLFLIRTSSSSIALNTSPDVARRATFIRVGPLTLPESIFIKSQGKDRSPILASAIRFGRYFLVKLLRLMSIKAWSILRSRSDGTGKD